jgi:hypothetical protein
MKDAGSVPSQQPPAENVAASPDFRLLTLQTCCRSRSPSLTPTMVDTPGSCIVTP